MGYSVHCGRWFKRKWIFFKGWNSSVILFQFAKKCSLKMKSECTGSSNKPTQGKHCIQCYLLTSFIVFDEKGDIKPVILIDIFTPLANGLKISLFEGPPFVDLLRGIFWTRLCKVSELSERDFCDSFCFSKFMALLSHSAALVSYRAAFKTPEMLSHADDLIFQKFRGWEK